MNWIITSLLMFASSVGLYLLIRKAALNKVPQQINNLAMFGIPLFAFLILGIVNKQNFLLTPIQYVIIFFVSIIFSYIGNVASLLSIEYAPNPGFSLVISKSYVVFTTLVAVVWFSQPLSWQNTAAIFLIVAFSALIMLDQKKTKKTTKPLWLPLAIVSFFCWGMLSLSSKYLFNQGVELYVFLSYAYIVVVSAIIAEIIIKKVNIGQIKAKPVAFLGVGLLSTGFNLFNFLSIQIAPNLGYVNAINAASISAVTIFAWILFKDELSFKKFVGVFGVIVGLFLLLL
jgi:drug/metabolite transporter (DMT)-like permease